jgi:hypothetical protein
MTRSKDSAEREANEVGNRAMTGQFRGSLMTTSPAIALKPKFEKGNIVELTLPVLKMASELGGSDLVAVLRKGDRLELGDQHPQGRGQVFRATVAESKEKSQEGKTGVVRVDWIDLVPEAAKGGEGGSAERSGKTEEGGVGKRTVDDYVDNFSEVTYDPDYRMSEEPTPTNWLQVSYDDGTTIDLHFDSIKNDSSVQTRDAIAEARVGIGGRVFPSEMNPKTTPRLAEAKATALEEQARLTNELILGALPAVIFVITLPAMPAGSGGGGPRGAGGRGGAKVQRVTGGRVSGARAARLKQIRATRQSLVPLQKGSQSLVEKLKNEGKDIIVNLGGAAAKHEPAHAINVNSQVVGRKGIPNLVEAPAEVIGSLFKSGQVDEVVGFRLSPNSFDWRTIAPGAFKILRAGGKFKIEFRWADHKIALQLAAFLQKAGFKNLEIIGDVAIKGFKP